MKKLLNLKFLMIFGLLLIHSYSFSVRKGGTPGGAAPAPLYTVQRPTYLTQTAEERTAQDAIIARDYAAYKEARDNLAASLQSRNLNNNNNDNLDTEQ